MRSRSHDRPRPGPVTRLLALMALGLASVLVFCALLTMGRLAAAASILIAIPAADLLLRFHALGRYVDRHLGLAATSHLITALWALAMTPIAVEAASSSIPARLTVAVAAVAAMTAAAERVAWARHPVGLAHTGLPGTDDAPGRGRLPVVDDVLWGGSALAQVAASAAVFAGAGGRSIGIWMGVVAGVYGLRAAAAVSRTAWRVLHGDSATRRTIVSGVAGHHPEVLFHFSGSVHTTYQLDQWMPFVASSGLRPLLVFRELETFRAAAGRWQIPAVYIKDFPDLDLVAVPSVRVALYVNTGTKNNHLVRFESMVHVQIHHGDSDKPVSSSKTMRLYDHHFVAGPAAADRLLRAGVAPGPGAISVVGRPQNRPLATGLRQGPGRSIVYAPTWEGFHVDAPLSSLAALGEALVDTVPTDIHLVVRPHPLTGSADRRMRHSLAEVRRALHRRGVAGRFVDPHAEDLAVTIAGADVLITDVSSVLVDFLAADRPAIVTDVGGIGEGEIHRRYPSTTWAGVLAADLRNLGALLEDAFGADRRRGERQAARSLYLGDVADPAAAFRAALLALARPPAGQGDRVGVEL